MDALLLSRIQFALTVGFHYLFPPLSIGLGLFLVIMEGQYLRTKIPLYIKITKFWVKIFALIFALGVASGIVMEFQFGTNWSEYSRFVGDVFGSALAAEGLFAFFLESSFLALLLFGWNRVGPRMHFFSTIMVAFGAHLSAFWIIIANSWQQTPAGHHIVETENGVRAEIVNFWQVVFNPSTIDRFTHVIIGCWLAAAFLVLSVGAYYMLRNRHIEFAKINLKAGLVIAVLASILQLETGHLSAMTVSETQPAKLAAFEGHYTNNQPADMYLFGWVNEKEEKVQYGIRIPGFLSFLVHFDSQAPVVGLDSYAPKDRPPVNIVFQTYHLMITIGMGLIFLSLLGIYLWWRKKLFTARWYLWILVFSVLLPQIANQVGWISAEVGRQPYIVYNLMRTEEAISTTLSTGEAWASLILFSLIYSLLFALFIYLFNHKIQNGPEELEQKQGKEAV